MKIDIEEIVKSDYSMEDVLVLMELEYARRGKFFPYSSTRKEQYISLYKRGVLNATPDGYTITVTGYQELRKIIGQEPLKLKDVTKTDKFDEFWKEFPTSDAHGKWMRTRSLKSNKARCQELYKRAIKNGVSHERIVNAVKWEVKDRKGSSNTSNKMSYMKNSAAWLNQKEYEIIEENIKDQGEDAHDNWTETTV